MVVEVELGGGGFIHNSIDMYNHGSRGVSNMIVCKYLGILVYAQMSAS